VSRAESGRLEAGSGELAGAKASSAAGAGSTALSGLEGERFSSFEAPSAVGRSHHGVKISFLAVVHDQRRAEGGPAEGTLVS